jgi:carbon-monoxide dehydrogenase small subunit
MNTPQQALVNGTLVAVPTDGTRLLDWLRDTVGLTSPKEGCGQGHCGACTVLVAGRATLSCCMFAAVAADQEVLTSDALMTAPLGEKLASAFIEHGAIQCGYCTPGMFVAAYALLEHNPGITEQEARAGLVGNVCRCTGYAQIIDAVMSVYG